MNSSALPSKPFAGQVWRPRDVRRQKNLVVVVRTTPATVIVQSQNTMKESEITRKRFEARNRDGYDFVRNKL